MSNNDLHNNIKQVQAIIPATIGANATKTGAIIDRQGYGGVEFVIDYGSVTTTGSIVTLVLKEGDVTGTLTSVADADMLGTEALASLAAGARVAGTGKEVSKRLGYKGDKRYVQLSAVQTGTTSVGGISATAILFNPSIVPIDNP
ncbi:MAG: hypothetical protein KDI69_03315 [Xanthomonadales bacterium]|nr:hypothetical protein [Xanthomonadales bacterium]